MSRIEAVYNGVLTRTDYRTDKEIDESAENYWRMIDSITLKLAPTMRAVKGEPSNKPPKGLSKIRMDLFPRYKKRLERIDFFADRFVYESSSEQAAHTLFDTLMSVAEASPDSNTSFEPDALAELSLQDFDFARFRNMTGVEKEEHVPIILQTTARALGNVAFQFHREVTQGSAYSIPYDYKSFTISSNGVN